MESEQHRFPTGDLALLAAVIVVGLWPFFALWLGESPPAWELGVGTVFVLVSGLAMVRALAGSPGNTAEAQRTLRSEEEF